MSDIMHYQVNSIRAGLRAIGRKKWHTATVHNGKIAVNSLILQSGGRNCALTTIRPTQAKQNRNVYLNFFKTFGISLKKDVFSTYGNVNFDSTLYVARAKLIPLWLFR